jgi:hypothetical protein
MIRANKGYELWGTKKIHLMASEFTVCGLFWGSDVKHDTCDIEELCGNCKRHTDAYTEVEPHIAAMPKGHRIMEKGETITTDTMFWYSNVGPWCRYSENLDILETITDCGEGVVTEDAYPHCCPIEPTQEEHHSTCNTCGSPVTDAMDQIKELEEKNELLIQTIESMQAKLTSIEATEQAALAMLPESVRTQAAALRALFDDGDMEAAQALIDEVHGEAEKKDRHIAELKERLDAVLDNYEDMSKAYTKAAHSLSDLKMATKGHTVENVAKAMGAMPPVAQLEGCVLEASPIDKCHHGEHGSSIGIHIHWKPIVQYIPTESITDELVAKHGSITCEVRDRDDQTWTKAVLVLIQANAEFGYHVIIEARPRRLHGWNRHCRIRQDVIDGLEKESK